MFKKIGLTQLLIIQTRTLFRMKGSALIVKQRQGYSENDLGKSEYKVTLCR